MKASYSPVSTDELTPTEEKIHQMNQAALSRLNTLDKQRNFLGVSFSIRGLIDYIPE